MNHDEYVVKLHEGIEFYSIDDADEFIVDHAHQKGESTVLYLLDGEELWVKTDNIASYEPKRGGTL